MMLLSLDLKFKMLQEVTKQRASVVKKPIKEERLLNAIKLLDR